MGDVILYKEDVDRLNFLLKNLIHDAKILSALLITKDTRVLACQGTLGISDPGALAALLVGSFASTQAIATLIGESEFETMTHLGKTKNVIISLINDETILASIFDNNTTAEIISEVAWRHSEVFRKALSAIGGNTANGLFDGPESSISYGDDDFEKRTDDLVKGVNAELASPPPAQPAEPQGPAQPRQPPQPQETRRAAETDHEGSDIARQKRVPLAPAASGAQEIRRPPDTKAFISEAHISSKDYEVYALSESATAPSSQTKRPAFSTHSREKKPAPPSAESPKADTASSSINYLQNKAREGALYYHHDKAFFKKFFKTSNKKKV